MKTPHTAAGRGCVFAGMARGLTLPELTLTVSVLLTLIGVLFAGSSIYASHANRASCVMAQDQIRKALTADANMRGETLRPGIDYFEKAVQSGVPGMPTACPEGGGSYSATVAAPGGQLEVTCDEHGDDHRRE